MQSMLYTIYKTTNLVNGKVYIGKHITKNLDDGYLGSGKLLQHAINKYGIENFHKEILHVFDNEDDMNAKEREFVTEDFVLQETNYNLCVGGQGGFSYINRNGLGGKYPNKTKMDLEKLLLAKLALDDLHKTPEFKTVFKQSISNGLKRYYQTVTGGHFAGKSHTEETKRKMSISSQGKSSGERNSQYGTCWITNGVENKKVKKTDSIPQGWIKGRT